MIDIYLVNTPQNDFRQGNFSLGNSRKNQPLDLALIAAMLKKDKFSVQIQDANLLRISHQEIANQIASSKPKMVILNTASIDRWECPMPTVKEPAILSTLIKEKSPNITIVAVGPHGTVTPNWLLEHCPNIDIAVRGEPEITVNELAKNFPLTPEKLNKILGISYRAKDEVINNPDRPYLENLDLLPIPAYDLLPMDSYGPMSDHYNGSRFEGETMPFSIMVTSRGCPGRCTFCLRKMFQDKKTFRSRSPQKIVEEISLLVNNFGIKAIYFQDLSFCTDSKRVIEICELIFKNNLKFSWGCEARFDHISLPMLSKMKEAGCTFINFGLESGSEKVLNLCQKNIPMEVIVQAIAYCQKVGISAGCFKLLGLPGEDKESFIETLEFMVKNKIEIPYPFPANKPLPYPGTDLHQQAEAEFKRSIFWEEAPEFAGKVGTKFYEEVSPATIQRLAYAYKLRQEGRKKGKHYLRLLIQEKIGNLKSLLKRVFAS